MIKEIRELRACGFCGLAIKVTDGRSIEMSVTFPDRYSVGIPVHLACLRDALTKEASSVLPHEDPPLDN